MKYRDRYGRETAVTTSQDKLLDRMYGNKWGRGVMKLLSNPIFSKLAGAFLSSSLSAGYVSLFADKHKIDLFDYEDRDYRSFNDFFTRQIKPGRRAVEPGEDVLVSPSDGRVSAYRLTGSNTFIVKNSVYTVESLLRDGKLAKRFAGGTALIIRLCPQDLHRYIYPIDGIKSRTRRISGFLHTVNPVVNRHVCVYKENTREYCLIRSSIGDLIQMEVGALNVGKITDLRPGAGRVRKGEEKGYFEFGGSTIILLLPEGVRVREDFFRNTREGFETLVRRGERVSG